MNETTTMSETNTETTQRQQIKAQARYKSWALWLSIFGAIGVILNSTGILEKVGLTSETWNIVINAIGSILIALGIVNNPTSKNTL